MVWIGRSDFNLKCNEPLRLAAFDPPCFFRAAAVASLECADIDWSIGYASNSLSDLWSAVSLGLGVTCPNARWNALDPAVLDRQRGLSELPPLHASLRGPPPRSQRPAIDCP
jgi:DNA-binding transcriptional LysR family regulator